MKSCIKKKIQNQKGESIGETLVSLLISSLGLIMLAGAITTSSRIVSVGEEKMEELYKATNDMIEGNISEGSPVNEPATGTFSLIPKDGLDSHSYGEYQVTYYWHDLFKDKKVVIYHK